MAVKGWNGTPFPWRRGISGNNRVYAPDCLGEESGLIAVVYKHSANATGIAALGQLIEALQTHQEWCRREKAGPPFPEGMDRDSPEARQIGSDWFYENVDWCAKAERLTDEALRAAGIDQ